MRFSPSPSSYLILLCFAGVSATNLEHTFVFLPTNEISYKENWLNKDSPCQDDHIVFEDAKKTIAYFDEDLQVSQILLPEDGSVYFGDQVTVGAKSKQQCGRRRSPEDVFFQVDPYFGSYFDPANWEPDYAPLLHMNMVPGANDHALFLTFSYQLFIDDRIKISRLQFGDREMTTESVLEMYSTMEGQYRISLGHRLSKSRDIDHIEFIEATKPPVLIEGKTFSERERRMGVRNPNLNSETLSLICEYVKCVPITGCIEPVRPEGHCCDICGALLDFRGLNTDQQRINEDAWSALVHENLDDVTWMSVSRLDEEETPARYQIALFSSNDSSVEAEYDQSVFEAALNVIQRKLRSRSENAIQVLSMDCKWSKMDRSYSQSARVLGAVSIVLVMIVVIAVVVWSDQPSRMRLHEWWSSTPVPALSIHWKRLKDEDTVDFVNPNHEHEELESEEEKESVKEFVSAVAPCSSSENLVNTQKSEEMTLIQF